MKTAIAFVLLALAACGGREGTPNAPSHHAAESNSEAAVTALRASKFLDARAAASEALSRDPRDARAAAVRAIAGYQIAGSELVHSLGAIIDRAEGLKFFDHVEGRKMWQTWLGKLEGVETDLAVVAADPQFALELCIACWEHDWNRNGEVDERDRKMFEIEFFPDQTFDDKTGEPMPIPEARRRPTFRFDVGDAAWARAMISFQRAAGEIVLAYKWSELDQVFAVAMGGGKMTIKLDDKARVKKARTLILAGLEHAEMTRTLYLAETDDDREWVPNPTQKNHPVPLEIDAKVYETWVGVIGDVRRMLESKEGISMREVASFTEDDDITTRAPAAFIDLGRLLGDPTDITIDLSSINGDIDAKAVEGILRGVLGNGYQTSMKPSPIVARLRTMKGDIDRGNDTFERKLRYLFWLN